MDFKKLCKTEKEIALCEVIFEGASLSEYISRYNVTATAANRQIQVMRQYLQYVLACESYNKKIA